MTTTEIKDAVAQMIAHCRLLMETKRYEYLSVREVLYTLGFTRDEADEIITCMATSGFNYCIDPIISTDQGRPDPDVCRWGVDQLESRLQSVHIYA